MGPTGKPEHSPNNYLKAVLESIVHYNAFARLTSAQWLLEGYRKSGSAYKEDKTNLTLELISKWMQTIEDLGALSLMFAGDVVSDNRDPYEIYAKCETSEIRKFYEKARRGLSKTTILKIYGLKHPRKLLKDGLINPEELNHFEDKTNEFVESEVDNFRKLGRAFTAERKSKSSRFKYSFPVKLYFHTKHGFKMISPTETAMLVWKLDSGDFAVVRDVKQLKNGRKVMGVSVLTDLFEDKLIKELMGRIEEWGGRIQRVADIHLQSMENPRYMVERFRLIKTEDFMINTGRKKIGRNEPCPCGSGVKFKRCCLPNLSSSFSA